MKTLFALLLLIPNLSWGNELIFSCYMDKGNGVSKNGYDVLVLREDFDLKIHEDRYLVEFSTKNLVGTKFMAIANRPLYDKSKVVKANHFDGSYFLYFDGVDFTLTKTDSDYVYYYFATCRKLF